MTFEKILREKMKIETSNELDQKILTHINKRFFIQEKNYLSLSLASLSICLLLLLMINMPTQKNQNEMVVNDMDLVQDYKDIELMNSSSVLNEKDWKEINEDII